MGPEPEGHPVLTQPPRGQADNGRMYTDPFLVHLWLWALARWPITALERELDNLPSRYGPRARA